MTNYQLKFDNTNVLVTGAAQGMGRSIAVAFGSLGARVVVDDIAANRSRLMETVEQVDRAGGKGVPITADITDPAEVERAMGQIAKEAGPIDVLINNAGVYRRGPSVEFALEEWDKVIGTNVKAHFTVSTAVARHFMIPRRRGKIVFISSTAAFFGASGAAAYCVSKAAVLQLMRALAVEWAAHGIQVNAVAPGYISTDFIGPFSSDPAFLAFMESRVPMKRIGTPEEVAGAVLFLASSLADYISGAHIEIDGGRTASG